MRTNILETVKKVNEEISVYGWMATKRDHGKIMFLDLRDRTGIIQVVVEKENPMYEKLAATKVESTLKITGTVKQRPENLVNKEMETGAVELLAGDIEVLSEADDIPFAIDEKKNEVSEDVRLKYRYLDLRRQKMHNNIVLRSKVVKFIRDFLTEQGFTDIETPNLGKSTPEGARDYLVPSRQQPGKFYALPQSPQQYKQLLMVAGFEKYYQIARCFRDEDTRGDRQAEFTQLDIEMSFVENEEEILKLVEEMFITLVRKVTPKKHITQVPFPRISYDDAMSQYGSDKPDLRRDKNDDNELAFAFVTDFPMFERSKQTGRWTAMHHPFTMPKTESVDEIKNNPETIKAHQYDFVLNGYEIAGGSIRTHKPEILEAVFEVLGHTTEQIRAQFGHLLQAFKYGVPPHGGIAPGLDRIVMLLANEPNIREVIAFPKTGDGRDLMMDAPSNVDTAQLNDLGIKIVDKPVKE